MSNESPTTPAVPEPHASSAQQPTQPYQPPAYQPEHYAARPGRPPLTTRAKSGAAWAGIIGFNLLTVGFFVFLVPLALLAMGSLLRWLVSSAIQQGNATVTPQTLEFFDRFDPAAWVVPLLIVSAVGLVIWIVALIISKAILRSSGAVKPWAITWASAGIAVFVYWIVWTIISFISSIVSSLIGIVTQSFNDQATSILIGGLISVVFALIINSVIGWLVWLWMAHAMRPTHEQLVTQE